MAVVLAMAVVAFAAAPAAANDDCERIASDLEARLHTARHVKEGAQRELASAIEATLAVAPACRKAGWHLALAHLLRTPENGGQPVIDGARRWEGPAQAVAAGLVAAPGDARLLAYAAFLARYGPGEPPALADDACERATADGRQQLADYVCGHLAARAGRVAEAARRFASVARSRSIPDGALCEAEALAAANRRSAARAATKRAFVRDFPFEAPVFLPDYRDRDAMVARLRAIERGAPSKK